MSVEVLVLSAIVAALCRRARRDRNTVPGVVSNLACHSSSMLSRLVLVSANALKGSGPLGAGLVQASRSLHASSQNRAPLPPLPETGGKVRHGIFPEEIFQLLYPKTGVTGPYMLGTGLLVYLLSKEIYIINHETYYAFCIGTILVYCVKKFGPQVAAYADKLNEEKVAKVQEVKDMSIANLTRAIGDEQKEQWRVEGRSMLFDTKRNNIALLLETNYRERLHMVTNEVKRRLDYQIALQDLQRRMAQEHMVNWVEKNVVSSITPQQEKESIAKCITDLKALAKATQAKAAV
ncbi:ATP synthase peripheral stalk subunit b, mitochondrial [Vanacampus margaritifer]